MPETATLQLPEETLEQYRLGAAISRKPLEEFLAERLVDMAPEPVRCPTAASCEQARELAQLSDEEVWQIARIRFPEGKQRVLTRLLHKNSAGTISPKALVTLHRLGGEARVLTLRKARAYELLMQRGHRIPTREELERTG